MSQTITQMLSIWRPSLTPTHVRINEFERQGRQAGEGLMVIYGIYMFVLITFIVIFATCAYVKELFKQICKHV